MLHASKQYGYTVGETSFDWGRLKEMRDAYVRRLNGIYHRNVEKAGVTLVYGVRFERERHTERECVCVCSCAVLMRARRRRLVTCREVSKYESLKARIGG